MNRKYKLSSAGLGKNLTGLTKNLVFADRIGIAVGTVSICTVLDKF